MIPSLCTCATRLMKQLDYGKGYSYAHDVYLGQPDPTDPMRPPAERPQEYLPEDLQGREYYRPGAQGNEASIRAWLARRRAPKAASIENDERQS
jgi:putative ATPase